jgi:hypothetical protein
VPEELDEVDELDVDDALVDELVVTSLPPCPPAPVELEEVSRLSSGAAMSEQPESARKAPATMKRGFENEERMVPRGRRWCRRGTRA